MKNENIDILNNMSLSISQKSDIIGEMTRVLVYKDYFYEMGIYSGYVNLLFILDYISPVNGNSMFIKKKFIIGFYVHEDYT